MLYSKIEGTGKPLIIIHGFLGMSDNWKTLGTQYSEAGFQVHILDLRNHGRSFHSEEFSYEIMAQDVLDYCIFNQLDKVSILGHSMGGKVAMLFAAKYPERIEKLIVADIGPKYYPPHHQTILAALKAVDFSQKPSRADVDVVLSQFEIDFGTRQFLLKNLYWQEIGQLAFRFNLKVLDSKIIEIGKALPKDLIFIKDTFFIKGGLSDYILDADIEAIKTQFPKAIFDTIPNAGHWLHAENQALFYKKTLNFLQQTFT
jgi:esterase